jgi:AcrR family transcriptional regulator
MEDRRIVKTKRILKQTMIELLAEKPFEQITVTELCQTAATGRITFYAHYTDKYELVDELFRDMLEQATADYYRMQKENNPGNEPAASFCNLLDAILNLYNGQYAFFSHTHADENPYLYYSFYRYIVKAVERHIRRRLAVLRPRYTPGQLAGFLCNGLWGFISESHAEKRDRETVRREARGLLEDLLRAQILAVQP